MALPPLERRPAAHGLHGRINADAGFNLLYMSWFRSAPCESPGYGRGFRVGRSPALSSSTAVCQRVKPEVVMPCSIIPMLSTMRVRPFRILNTSLIRMWCTVRQHTPALP